MIYMYMNIFLKENKNGGTITIESTPTNNYRETITYAIQISYRSLYKKKYAHVQNKHFDARTNLIRYQP